MSDSQCTCTDCAVALGQIVQNLGEIEEVFILISETLQSKALDLFIGEECEQEHNHPASKSCQLQYKCLGCDAIHEYQSDAEECSVVWECQFCGTEHSDGYYNSGKESAASCCVQPCDDCGEYGWPDWIEEHECESSSDDDSDPSIRKMRKKAPWAERGITIDATSPKAKANWKDVWDLKPEQHNVVQAAADFYLLEALSAGLVGTTDGKGQTNRDVSATTTMRVMREEASSLLDALVKVWDPILQTYTHIAVGGELRHHNAIGGSVLSGNRSFAWSGWKDVFDIVGADALTDANDLFLEFSGGSFGGKPWGDACLILHARITNKISPRMFLDRIFNAQHNGGCLLNKVQWAGDIARERGGKHAYLHGMALNDLTYRVLPAHGQDPEPDYGTLLAYASREVQALFLDTYEAAGHAFITTGVSISDRAVRPRKVYTKHQSSVRTDAFYENNPESKLDQFKYELKSAKVYSKDYAAYAVEMLKSAKSASKTEANYYLTQAASYQANADKYAATIPVLEDIIKEITDNPPPKYVFDWTTLEDTSPTSVAALCSDCMEPAEDCGCDQDQHDEDEPCSCSGCAGW